MTKSDFASSSTCLVATTTLRNADITSETTKASGLVQLQLRYSGHGSLWLQGNPPGNERLFFEVHWRGLPSGFHSTLERYPHVVVQSH